LFLYALTCFIFYCHCRIPLAQFANPFDDPVVIDGEYMFILFGRCEMIESDIMDYIISYWKDDPNMKYMFEGDRVLLGPFTIPALFLPYTFYTFRAISFSSCH
jgi:hypothetical protein